MLQKRSVIEMDDKLDAVAPRLLVIDDNRDIHNDIRKILEAQTSPSELDALDAELFGEDASETPSITFAIDSAYQGQEGLVLLKQAMEEGRPYTVAFVDMRMPPGWDGVETIQRLWEVDPNLQVVICTAYSDHSWEEMANQLDTRDRLLILKKPFDIIEIRQMAHALSQKRILSEALTRANSARYRVLYDDNPSMFVTLSDDFQILSANRYGATYMGYKVSELVGRQADVLYTEEEWDAVREHIAECFENAQAVQQWETRKQRKDGTFIWVRESGRVIDDPDSGPALLLVCEDVTCRHEAEEKLSYEASHDALTGLPNRRTFERKLHLALMDQDEKSEHALCFIDLDQFKVVNDTCSHLAGDELLRQIGDLLAEHVRNQDTVARLGGDEFGLLLEHCPLDAARKRVESLHNAIGKLRFSWDGRVFVVGASIGLVPLRGTGNSLNDALRAADTACYLAKDNGRNRISISQIYDPELAKQHAEMEWSTRIHWALEHGGLCLYYQPIVPANGDNTKKYIEMLVRMRCEDGSIALPGAFLPSAQRYGLMVQLDRWVVKSSLEWLSENSEHLQGLDTCCVNLSGQALCDDQFLEFLLDLLVKHRQVAEKVCFEITESAAITNMSRALGFVKQLKNFGCRFSLDDFGSGYSSFAYLRAFPVDFLKIDGSFIKGIEQDYLDFLTVRSICEVGDAMGTETIAEFVSSEGIRNRLQEIGIDYFQGFLLGRPAPLDTFLEEPQSDFLDSVQTGLSEEELPV